MSWALNASLEQGIVWAFIGGICKDLLSAAPLGTSVLGMLIIIFAMHSIRSHFYSVGIFTLLWVTLAGTIVQQLSIFIILLITGFAPAFASRLGYGIVLQQISYITLPTIVYNLALILPIYWMVRRIQ
jgi:rod shape-determining protein MreD